MLSTAILLLAFAVLEAPAQEFCGTKEPVDTKTCISLRLPWQEDPIYFCTAKENIKYKDRCKGEISNYCRVESKNLLQVATPWDCCPITSVPDPCSDRHCPKAPFNRTCTAIESDGKNAWDCCPKYYCEAGPVEMCHVKKLQPGCSSPPKSKTNCVGFRDQHGCCNKYQCDGEAKSGLCPMEAQALQFKKMMENNSSEVANTMTHPHLKMSGRYPISGPLATTMQCVGDYTCPGQMKCCSLDMGSYHGVHQYLSRGMPGEHNAIYGYCMEPLLNDLS